MSKNTSAGRLALGFLSKLSATSEVSDALYLRVIDAGVSLWGKTGLPEPSAQLVLTVERRCKVDQLLQLVSLVASPDTIDALCRRDSKLLRRMLAVHPALPAQTAVKLARWSARPSVSDLETFEALAGNPHLDATLAVELAAGNGKLASETVWERLGRLCATQPASWSVAAAQNPHLAGSLLAHVGDGNRLELLALVQPEWRGEVARRALEPRHAVVWPSRMTEEVAMLVLRADARAVLSGLVDCEIPDPLLERLAASSRVNAPRLLLLNRHVPAPLRRKMLERAADASGGRDQMTLLHAPSPAPGDLVDVVVSGTLSVADAARAVELLPDQREVRLELVVRVEPVLQVLARRDRSGALMNALARSAATLSPERGWLTPSWLEQLVACEQLDTEVLLTLLRSPISCWEVTCAWWAAAMARGDHREVPVLAALFDDAGYSLSSSRAALYNLSTPTRDEAFERCGALVAQSGSQPAVDWLLRTWPGALRDPRVAAAPAVVDWLAEQCALAGVDPSAGLDLLLSLIVDWDGTAAELVDTVAAVN